MHRILAALIASAALLAFAAPASAQNGAMAAPTKAAHMSSSMKKSSSMSSMGSMKMATTACPKGQSMVKGYTKKDGTKVAAYCRKSK
jgi:nitrous oxide reductase accessory protein NosL